MPSIATLYIWATTAIFFYTTYEHLQRSDTYFKAIMTYFADQKYVFILYNMILSVAIILYRLFTAIFFVNTMQGEVVKITDKLKSKILDLIILAYIIELKFNFQMYVLVTFVVFSFILHNHLVFRSEYLVHIHTTSTALSMHYRAIALYLVLFFVDYQILKYIVNNMLSATEATQAIFIYYMVTNAFLLLQPFLQFACDFYEKYTFSHIKNSDQIIATASVLITIPRLLLQLLMCVWLSLQFKQIFFAVIRGIEIISNIKNTYQAYVKIKKLSQTMSHLKKMKGEELQQFHDLTCTVCYEDMKEAILLPCKHIFHQECIRQWIIKNLNHFCPKCKHELNFDNVQALYEVKKKEQETTTLDKMRGLIEQQNMDQTDKEQAEQELNHLVQQEEQQMKNIKQKDENQYIARKQHRQYDRDQELQNQQQIQPDYYQQAQRQIQRQHERGQRIEVLDRKGRPIIHKKYILNRPQLSELPLQVYESMKKKIIPLGSMPYGMPAMAVSNRRSAHMSKRQQYMRDMYIITQLLQMDRNQQLLLL